MNSIKCYKCKKYDAVVIDGKQLLCALCYINHSMKEKLNVERR